jgi:hypothetical protein
METRTAAEGVRFMGKHEYHEGTKAQENFEEGMKHLFKVPKGEVVKAEKKKQKASRASRLRKQKSSDRD